MRLMTLDSVLVRIFVKNDQNFFIQQGTKLIGTGNSGSSSQGSSVSLAADGNTLAIGAPSDNNIDGATWIFTQSGGTWSQLGTKLIGTGASGARQGNAVKLSGDGKTLAIGGFTDNNDFGATWIFTKNGGTWAQQGSKLVGNGAVGNDNISGNSCITFF